MALRELLFQINLKENASDLIKLLDEGFDNIKDRIPRTTRDIEAMSKKLGDMGSNLSLKLTAPIVGFGTAAAKMGMDFETSMAKVSTIADNTAVSMADMSKDIIRLSNDTGIAATDLAEDIYNAISAGQSTADAVGFVESSSKLAKAGFAESAEALDILTTTLNAYGLESEEVGRVSDVLIQIQNKGKTTVGELSSTMGKVIPTAKAMGVNLEQLGAGFALMTSNGIATAETTTYMSSMLNEMGKSGTGVSKTIKELTGKSFKELMEDGRDIGYVLHLLNEEAINTGVGLSDMFGSAEAGKAALILAQGEGKNFTNMLGEMNNVAGATDEAFEKVTDTAAFRFGKAMNELKNNMILLGDAFIPVVDKISEFASGAAQIVSAMSPQQIQNLAIFAGVLASLGPIMLVVSKAMQFYALVTGVQFIGAVTGAIAAFKGFTIALLANPLTWVIIGLVAVGVALWKLAENWDKVREFLKTQSDRVKADFQETWNQITTLFNSINLFESGANIIRGLINGIASMAGELWSQVTEIANGIANKFKNFFGIASPSKLMFEYGGFIGEGLELGMQSKEQSLESTAGNMGTATEGGLVGSTSSSASFAPTFNMTINANGSDARRTGATVRAEVEKVLSDYEKKMMLRWGAVNG